MEEWKERKVSELIQEISMGPFGSNIKVDNFVDSGVPVLNGSNLQGYKLNEDSFNYVSEEKADSLGKASAHRGDIVITHRGTLGQIIYIPQNSKFNRYVISQSQFRLKLKSEIVRPDYFVYFFHTRIGQHKILMNASQVGVPALARPTTTFKEVSIPIPPLSVQDRIMAILLCIDDKIELNHKINSNLEEQAKALFKSWFIDFEPFKGGKFVESEFGMIPEGWEVSYLEHLGKFKRGKTIIAKNAKEGLIPVVAGGMEPAYYHNVANTKGPVITVSASGANAGYMRLYYQDVWASDCSFLDNSNENLLWIYCFLNNNRRVLRHAQTGAVQPHVKPADINSITVCIPPHDLISKFQNTVSPLFKSIGLHQQETERLQKTRDTLLPKLMSGEIDVEHSKLLFI